jgi:hypothetical protein
MMTSSILATVLSEAVLQLRQLIYRGLETTIVPSLEI